MFNLNFHGVLLKSAYSIAEVGNDYGNKARTGCGVIFTKSFKSTNLEKSLRLHKYCFLHLLIFRGYNYVKKKKSEFLNHYFRRAEVAITGALFRNKFQHNKS